MANPAPLTQESLSQILSALDAAAKAKENKVVTWLKTNWLHAVGHLGTWTIVSGAIPWVLKHL
jgi:hypothetical protein